MKLSLAANRTGWAAHGTLLVIFMLLAALAPSSVRAHKVTVFAWVEGDTVITQSKFAGGRWAQNARIEVYDATGQKLLEGQTDANGRFAFKPPRPQALRVVLMAGSGHRGEWRVAAEEFNASPTATAPRGILTKAERPESDHGHAHPAVETVTLSADELQKMIEAALEKKLIPVRRRLEQPDQGPALKDIFGGIGYIVGLVGLVAYLRSRRKTG